ncbi:MAG: EAL domain-containing protein [Thermomicrobiales bacterium]
MRSIDEYAVTEDVFDAIDAHVAILDELGDITFVNAAWRRFAFENQGDLTSCGVGMNYLAVTRSADDDPIAKDVADGIQAILDGRRARFSIEYPCHAPDEERWYVVTATATALATGRGAILLHSNSTEMHHALDHADDQERRFSTLVRYASDIVTILKADGSATFVSPSLEPLLGYRPNEMVGNNIFDFAHPDEVDAARQAMSDVRDQPYAFRTVEARVLHKNGTWRTFECTFTNLLEDPNIQGIIVNSRDITERQAAILQLSERAESFSTLFHGTAEAMIIHDGSRFILVNDAYAAILGIEASTIVGQSLQSFVAPESRQTVVDRLAEQSSQPYEILAQRADGTHVPVELLGRPVRYESRWLRLLTVRDVTVRKENQRKLKESEARFRALVQDASDIVVVFDSRSQISYANPALARILGYTEEHYAELLSLDLVHPDDHGALIRNWRAAVETPGSSVELSYRIRHRDGRWVWLEGTLKNLLDEPAVKGLVLNGRDMSDQKRLEDELRHFALHDPLTSLPNRTLLIDRMDQAMLYAHQLGHAETLAVLVVDLDQLKSINDRFGHAAGDAVLIEAARRIAMQLTLSQTLARLGGDGFVVLLPSVIANGDVEDMARRLLAGIAQPFSWGEQIIHLKASIGIAMSQEGAEDSISLLVQADNALFEAKRRGGGGYASYSRDVSDSVLRQYVLATDVYMAAERNQFVLHYQPIFDLNTGRIFKVEALIRWTHPTYGLVSPDEFIPLAEANGSITDIGKWVIGDVCRQMQIWGDDSPLVSINLSTVQFSDPDITKEIESCFAEYGLETNRLCVEITERIVIKDFELARMALEHFRELGIMVAIDDFGNGFSSLRYLKDLPVAAIKLDRSFASGLGTDPGALAIVNGIVSLAHAIGLLVTGEGIETELQLETLRDVGCDFGQGYYLARPGPAESVPPLPSVL